MKTCRRCGQTDPNHPDACGLRVRKVERDHEVHLLADRCGVIVELTPRERARLRWERLETPEGSGGAIIRWVAWPERSAPAGKLPPR